LTEGRHWLQELLDASDDIASVPRIKALIGLGWVCYWLAELDAAEACHRRALGLLDHLDDPWLRAEALLGVIITLGCHRAQVETAIPFEAQLQALIANHPHPVLILLGIVSSGTLRRFSGDLEGARTLALEGVAMTRKAGNRWWEGEALRALGQISYEQGRHEEAEEHLRESLAQAWEIGHRTGLAIDLDWLARVAVARGCPAAGVVLATAASRLRERLGGAFTVQDYRPDLEAGEVAARRVLTEPEFDRARAQGRAMNPAEAVAYARAFTDMAGP
jgi:tetratricopeptide (TPR) repeat protein